jgi:hypothetical protein
VITLLLEQGLGFRASLDPTVAGMLARLDGRQTPGEVTADLGWDEGTSREAVEAALVPIAREMLGPGFLVLV